MQLHRKTRRRFERCGDVRFLTSSCFQRLPLFNNDAIKEAFVQHIARSRQRTMFQLTAWVIMPEHVHLMLIPNLPDHPVSDVLSDMKATFSRTVLQRWRSLNAPILSRLTDNRGKARFWQVGGGYDRNIITSEEYEEKLHYIHQNPVARGLVESSTDWRWSSARWYSGVRTGELTIDPLSF